MWALNRFWTRRQLRPWPDLTESLDGAKLPIDAAAAPVVITVPLGTLTLTGFAPAVALSDHKTVNVPLGALTLTGFAPGIVISGDITPVSGGGFVTRSYTISGRDYDYAPEVEPAIAKHHVAPQREPFQSVKPSRDLKVLREQLFELGRLLARKKQAVKARIKAEQAAAARPELAFVIQGLIAEYQLELHNQNAARLLLILAEVS